MVRGPIIGGVGAVMMVGMVAMCPRMVVLSCLALELGGTARVGIVL